MDQTVLMEKLTQLIATWENEVVEFKQAGTDYLLKFGKASRSEIDDLLLNKLSDALDGTQKINKIGNLLTNLRRAGKIKNTGSRKTPSWVIAE